jgi:mono/diheme cytochrome c family protein
VADWKTIRPLLLAALATAAAGALGALAYIKSGIYDVGAAKPHTRFTEWVTHETMIHSVRSHAKGITAPSRFSSAQVAAGLCQYQTHCVACHGASAVPREPWVSGMEPSPPYLLDATVKWKPRELFWIVSHGIKMTGMPSWRNSLSDEQVWDVVAWIEASRTLPPRTFVQSSGRCDPIARPAPARPAIPRP